MTDTPAVLIVGPSWVGDMVLAQSLFKVLKQHSPDTAIDVLAPGWSEPLLARMPQVRDSITMSVGHGQLKLGERYRLGKSLRSRAYGQAIVLPNSFKSALVPFWASIPKRTGYRGEMRWRVLNDMRPLDKNRLYMTVERFVALGLDADAALPRPLPNPELSIDRAGVESALGAQGLQRPQAPVLALCPGAEYGPAKRWPASYFAQVARIRMQQGWAVWVFGSANDAQVADQVCAEAGEGCVNLAGRTSLAQAIDLLSLATVVVSNDSGLMHVAAAVGSPLVAIYGSSDPKFTPPMSPKARILSLGLECSPCFQRECPLGHLRCLRDIEPKSVEAAVLELVH
jgi:heptosyltransferase-2